MSHLRKHRKALGTLQSPNAKPFASATTPILFSSEKQKKVEPLLFPVFQDLHANLEATPLKDQNSRPSKCAKVNITVRSPVKYGNNSISKTVASPMFASAYSSPQKRVNRSKKRSPVSNRKSQRMELRRTISELQVRVDRMQRNNLESDTKRIKKMKKSAAMWLTLAFDRVLQKHFRVLTSVYFQKLKSNSTFINHQNEEVIEITPRKRKRDGTPIKEENKETNDMANTVTVLNDTFKTFGLHTTSSSNTTPSKFDTTPNLDTTPLSNNETSIHSTPSTATRYSSSSKKNSSLVLTAMSPVTPFKETVLNEASSKTLNVIESAHRRRLVENRKEDLSRWRKQYTPTQPNRM